MKNGIFHYSKNRHNNYVGTRNIHTSKVYAKKTNNSSGNIITVHKQTAKEIPVNMLNCILYVSICNHKFYQKNKNSRLNSNNKIPVKTFQENSLYS
jgi:hypothetical protein